MNKPSYTVFFHGGMKGHEIWQWLTERNIQNIYWKVLYPTCDRGPLWCVTVFQD